MQPPVHIFDIKCLLTTFEDSGVASGGSEGVGGCVIRAGIGEDGQGAHSGEDDEDPEEHAVHHHGYVLPVLPQLCEDGWEKIIKGREAKRADFRNQMYIKKQEWLKRKKWKRTTTESDRWTYCFVVLLSLQGLSDVRDGLYGCLQLLR